MKQKNITSSECTVIKKLKNVTWDVANGSVARTEIEHQNNKFLQWIAEIIFQNKTVTSSLFSSTDDSI